MLTAKLRPTGVSRKSLSCLLYCNKTDGKNNEFHYPLSEQLLKNKLLPHKQQFTYPRQISAKI